MQLTLDALTPNYNGKPLKGQLLKWIGNKQRYAEEIARNFPVIYGRYIEPFLGSGAVLATVAPNKGIASDTLAPLVQIWTTLKNNPELLKEWYAERYAIQTSGDKKTGYEQIKASYNANPNGADLVFLCRACYGGVVRFRKHDGYMSTPIGIHEPISPESFNRRVDDWHYRTQGTEFFHQDYTKTFELANEGDIIYCDPPYTYSQAILYGAQSFSLNELFASIEEAKERGVYVALSIDGVKKSGTQECELYIPEGLFEQEMFIQCGRSMLRRFQMGGQTLEAEHVADRLLLTY